MWGFFNSSTSVEKFNSDDDRMSGLLKYESIPKDKVFIFIFPKEEKQEFHTLRMKFTIGINFYDKSGKLIKTYPKCEPNKTNINSIKPIKYAVEYLYKGD